MAAVNTDTETSSFNHVVEIFQKIPKNSKEFQIIPKNSKNFQKIPKNSKKFQKIPRNSKKFQKIPKNSKKFQKIPKNSKKFQKIPKNSKKIQKIPSEWWQKGAVLVLFWKFEWNAVAKQNGTGNALLKKNSQKWRRYLNFFNFFFLIIKWWNVFDKLRPFWAILDNFLNSK